LIAAITFVIPDATQHFVLLRRSGIQPPVDPVSALRHFVPQRARDDGLLGN